MDKFHLSIISNRALIDILKELKLSEINKVDHYESLNIFLDRNIDLDNENKILICDYNQDLVHTLDFQKEKTFVLFLTRSSGASSYNKKYKNLNYDFLFSPFKIHDFISKIKFCYAKNNFLKKSFVKIFDYNLDVNKREIVKNNSKLKLTEKEVNFLMYLKNSKTPIKIEKLLTNVWNYSHSSETHTVETHVHRLRKKFLKVFKENNLIKNNKRGYFL